MNLFTRLSACAILIMSAACASMPSATYEGSGHKRHDVAASGMAEAPTEVIAYQVPLDVSEWAAGGVPIVNGLIYTGLQGNPEIVLKNAATAQMSTAKISPFAALTGSQQTDKYIQDITVINLDTTGAVCLYTETWAQTCSSSIAFTCLGATLQGAVVPAGATRQMRFTGQVQICASASEAAVDAQLERNVFYAKTL